MSAGLGGAGLCWAGPRSVMAATGVGAAGPEGATTGCGLPDDQPGCGPVAGGCGPVAVGSARVAGRAPRVAGCECAGCGWEWEGMAEPGPAMPSHSQQVGALG